MSLQAWREPNIHCSLVLHILLSRDFPILLWEPKEVPHIAFQMVRGEDFDPLGSLSGVLVVAAAIVLVYKFSANQDANVTHRSPEDQ